MFLFPVEFWTRSLYTEQLFYAKASVIYCSLFPESHRPGYMVGNICCSFKFPLNRLHLKRCRGRSAKGSKAELLETQENKNQLTPE
jgi:hypothetical protein